MNWTEPIWWVFGAAVLVLGLRYLRVGVDAIRTEDLRISFPMRWLYGLPLHTEGKHAYYWGFTVIVASLAITALGAYWLFALMQQVVRSIQP